MNGLGGGMTPINILVMEKGSLKTEFNTLRANSTFLSWIARRKKEITLTEMQIKRFLDCYKVMRFNQKTLPRTTP